MRKYKLLSLIVGTMMIIPLNVYGWTFQTNPLGSAMLGKVQFVSQTEGWISAASGRLLHTTNGGSDWLVVTPFPNDTLVSMSDPSVTMSWVNETHGWKINAMGTDFGDVHGGVVHKTTDGGSIWDKNILSVDSGDFGLQIQFVNESNGWASVYNFVTGLFKLFSSTDGGNNWNHISTPAGGLFYFVDTNNGWIISAGPEPSPPYEIMKTTDGGVNWTVQYTDNTEGGFNAIQFADLNHGWVVGENGKIIKTTDGGLNWTSLTNTGVTNFETYHSKCVYFLDSNIGWIGTDADGVAPIVLYTEDGGANWTTQPTPIDGEGGYDDIFSIFFWDVNNGWLTADYGKICNYQSTGIEQNSNIIKENKLNQNYPNPFNPKTQIEFSLEKNAEVKLMVYNVNGQIACELVNGKKNSGHHTVEFDGSDLNSGLYYYTLEVEGETLTQKMILIK